MCYFSNAMNVSQRQQWLRVLRDAIDVSTVDVVIASGLSGASLGALAAHALDVPLVLVRKPSDDTHSQETVEYSLGDSLGDGVRALFVDDLISSGRTLAYTWKKVHQMFPHWTLVGAFVSGKLRPLSDLGNILSRYEGTLEGP